MKNLASDYRVIEGNRQHGSYFGPRAFCYDGNGPFFVQRRVTRFLIFKTWIPADWHYGPFLTIKIHTFATYKEAESRMLFLIRCEEDNERTST